MSFDRKVVVRSRRRVFDGFFKLDELTLSHRLFDGGMSLDKKYLVFERGDAVAAIIFVRETSEVVLVEQLKVPTLDKSASGGWTLEVMAGMIRPGETPDACVVREALEETGYRLRDPEPIATFFSSPGGSSERIFLYHAVVDEADHVGQGGGVRAEGEDIRIVRMPVAELFERLVKREIEDPKLVIAAYHLRDRLKVEPPKPRALQPGSIRYTLGSERRIIVGLKTGDIRSVRGVDVWVNSENTDMMMDRVIGKSISANIRYAGAEKDEHGNVIEDTIANGLREKLGRRGFVKLGTVLETVPGALREHGVKRILHVAAVQGMGPGMGVRADPAIVGQCALKVLEYAEKRSSGFRLLSRRDTSILIPLMGAGDGGVPVEQVAPRIVAAIETFLARWPSSNIQQVYLLSYTSRDQAACERALSGMGALKRLEDERRP